MDLTLDTALGGAYKSPSQIARVVTQAWVAREGYCVNCGSALRKYPENRPVADFFCPGCHEQYELKSKRDRIGDKIANGAYGAKIQRLRQSDNPSLFLLAYSQGRREVLDFLVIPKHYFVPAIIERRNPLAPTAQRAPWLGSNILLRGVPVAGRVYLVKDGRVEPRNRVLAEWRRTLFLREEKDAARRGWLLDVMSCVDKLGKEFSLEQVYAFEGELAARHPLNKHIKDKIRQQLQILRDRAYLDFKGSGTYRLRGSTR